MFVFKRFFKFYKFYAWCFSLYKENIQFFRCAHYEYVLLDGCKHHGIIRYFPLPKGYLLVIMTHIFNAGYYHTVFGDFLSLHGYCMSESKIWILQHSKI